MRYAEPSKSATKCPASSRSYFDPGRMPDSCPRAAMLVLRRAQVAPRMTRRASVDPKAGRRPRAFCAAVGSGQLKIGLITVAVYAVLMTAVVVAVDVLFFRNRLWERLMVNFGIVLVFAAFYLRFLKRP